MVSAHHCLVNILAIDCLSPCVPWNLLITLYRFRMIPGGRFSDSHKNQPWRAFCTDNWIYFSNKNLKAQLFVPWIEIPRGPVIPFFSDLVLSVYLCLFMINSFYTMFTFSSFHRRSKWGWCVMHTYRLIKWQSNSTRT